MRHRSGGQIESLRRVAAPAGTKERCSRGGLTMPLPHYLICLIAALLACHTGRSSFQRAALCTTVALVILPLTVISGDRNRHCWDQGNYVCLETYLVGLHKEIHDISVHRRHSIARLSCISWRAFATQDITKRQQNGVNFFSKGPLIPF